MNIYELRTGKDVEIIAADARGVRSGKIPLAVLNYAKGKLAYRNRYGDRLYPYAEISLVELPNVSTGSPGMRQVLELLQHEEG